MSSYQMGKPHFIMYKRLRAVGRRVNQVPQRCFCLPIDDKPFLELPSYTFLWKELPDVASGGNIAPWQGG